MTRHDAAIAWLMGDLTYYYAFNAFSMKPEHRKQDYDDRALCELGEDLFYELRAISEAEILLRLQRRKRKA